MVVIPNKTRRRLNSPLLPTGTHQTPTSADDNGTNGSGSRSQIGLSKVLVVVHLILTKAICKPNTSSMIIKQKPKYPPDPNTH